MEVNNVKIVEANTGGLEKQFENDGDIDML